MTFKIYFTDIQSQHFLWQVFVTAILVALSLWMLIGQRPLDASDFALIAWRPGQQFLATGAVDVGYPYPLWTVIVMLPFSIWPMYTSMSLWLVCNVLMLSVSIVLLHRLLNLAPNPVLFLLLAPLFSLYLPVVTSVWLGQLTLFSLLLLLLIAYAFKCQQWFWLGVYLGLSFIKPQTLILLVGFMLLWALVRHRWRVWLGFGLVILILVAISLPFISEPRQLIGGGISVHLAEYIRLTSTVWGLLISLGISWIVSLIISLALLAWNAYLWLPLLRGEVQSDTRVQCLIAATALVNLIVVPYSWMHNLSLLILPLALGLSLAWQMRGAARWLWSVALIVIMYPLTILVFVALTAPLDSQGYQVIPALVLLPVFYLIERQYRLSNPQAL